MSPLSLSGLPQIHQCGVDKELSGPAFKRAFPGVAVKPAEKGNEAILKNVLGHGPVPCVTETKGKHLGRKGVVDGFLCAPVSLDAPSDEFFFSYLVHRCNPEAKRFITKLRIYSINQKNQLVLSADYTFCPTINGYFYYGWFQIENILADETSSFAFSKLSLCLSWQLNI